MNNLIQIDVDIKHLKQNKVRVAGAMEQIFQGHNCCWKPCPQNFR